MAMAWGETVADDAKSTFGIRRNAPWRSKPVSEKQAEVVRRMGLDPTGMRAGQASDLIGAFIGQGPVAPILGSAPHAAIGFVEAHGLAFILGVLLWRAAPVRSWHATGATIHLLLGVSNLAFWPIFAAGDMLAVGYVTTILHGTFAALQMIAAAAGARVARPA